MKYLEICDLIKKQAEYFKEVFLQDLHAFIVEESINKKGRYRVVLSFNAKEILKNPKGIPTKESDFKLRPLLLFLNMDWDKVKEFQKTHKETKK